MLEIFLSIENEEERQTAEDIWYRYEKHMYKLAKKVLKNDEEAHDAVMDAIYSMVKNIKKFMELSELDTVCLMTVYVRNAALKIYNKNKKNIEYTVSSENIDLLSAESNVEDIVVTEEQYEYLSKHLKNMPEKYAYPFIMRHCYEYSIKQIAAILNLNEETVKKRLYRAKLQLIDTMEHDYA